MSLEIFFLSIASNKQTADGSKCLEFNCKYIYRVRRKLFSFNLHASCTISTFKHNKLISQFIKWAFISSQIFISLACERQRSWSFKYRNRSIELTSCRIFTFICLLGAAMSSTQMAENPLCFIRWECEIDFDQNDVSLLLIAISTDIENDRLDLLGFRSIVINRIKSHFLHLDVSIIFPFMNSSCVVFNRSFKR